MMKLCTGSLRDSNGWYLVALSQCKAETVNILVPSQYKAFIADLLAVFFHISHCYLSWNNRQLTNPRFS